MVVAGVILALALRVDELVAYVAPWFGIIPAIVALAPAWLVSVEATVLPVLAYEPPFGPSYGGSGLPGYAIAMVGHIVTLLP